MEEIAQETRKQSHERHELRVERQVDHPGMLFVEGGDHRLHERNGLETRREEPVERVLGEGGAREERRLDVSGEEESGADARGVVPLVELVTDGLVQGYEGSFGRIVIRWMRSSV